MPKIVPTPAETVALQVLWERGQATVPQLHESICRTAEVGYTTVLKRIQRMESKGLIKRVPGDGRALTYQAICQPQKTRKTLVERLLASAFDDSPNALIQHAIGQHELSGDDIAEIRSLLDQVESKGRK